MTTVDSWPVEISLREEDGKTRAEARLTKDGVGMTGHGLARRNPGDQQVTDRGGDRGRAGPVRPCAPVAQRRGRADRGHYARARPPVAIGAARSPGPGLRRSSRAVLAGRERGGGNPGESREM